jgi:excisionase family DNA binding protein
MNESHNSNFVPEPALFNTKQAAIFLGVSPRTIKNLLRAKELTRRKIGRRTLVPKTSLEAFLKRDHATK